MKDLDMEWARLINQIMDAEWAVETLNEEYEEFKRQFVAWRNSLSDDDLEDDYFLEQSVEWNDEGKRIWTELQNATEWLKELREEERKAGYSVTFQLTDEPPSFLRD